jgi:sulfatase modifying factor 1
MGHEMVPGGVHQANVWQGPFPWRDFAADGFAGTCPVRSFPSNGHGLFEMCGNVWEWTRDGFAARHEVEKTGCCSAPSSLDPRQSGSPIPQQVVKGGSFLCAPSYCRRYRPAARHAQMIDSGMSHIGFRCVRYSANP